MIYYNILSCNILYYNAMYIYIYTYIYIYIYTHYIICLTTNSPTFLLNKQHVFCC